MTIHVQDAEAADHAETASPKARDERRNALVLLACVMVGIAMVGLLLDSVTENFVKTRSALPVDVAVPVPGALDTFTRPDNARTLGKAESGQPWRSASGTWGIDNDTARVITAGDGPSLAVLPAGLPNGRIEVTFATVAPGIGFAFRCRNALNCWRVEAVPEFGTWNVMKTVSGKETAVGSLGTVPVADGTKVAVALDGPNQVYFVDGQEVKRFEDPDFAFEDRAGLALREPTSAAAARWSKFEMTPHIGPGILTKRDASIYDEFERARAAQLGTTPTGQRWESVSGTWSAADGMAGPVEPAANVASLALLDTGSGDGIVQSTMLAPQKDSGIAFRCRDAQNCFRLEVVPPYGTWNLDKVENGKTVSLGNVGVAATAAGTTVSVELRGPVITVFVNGVALKTFQDPALMTETRAGLVVNAGGFAADARWGDFLAEPDKVG